jgi:hypothetical protein
VGSSTATGDQQQQDQHTGSSSGSGCDGLNGVQLDSLTPLSCGLFGILGVTKETALHAAQVLKSEGVTTRPDVAALAADYIGVLKYQVSGVML